MDPSVTHSLGGGVNDKKRAGLFVVTNKSFMCVRIITEYSGRLYQARSVIRYGYLSQNCGIDCPAQRN